MKKIFSFFAAALMAAGVASAQDINKAIELANNGNEAFQMGEYQLAVDAFTQSLAIAEGLGETGAEHANTCKTALGAIYLANSKNLIKSGDFTGALAKLDETIAVADKYGLTDLAEDAKSLIPNVYMAMGNAALKAKDMANAIAAYTKVTELNPTNGDAYLRLGMALAATGKISDAVTAYETAAANGEAKDANKQLSNLFLKIAQASRKTQKWDLVLENAKKALSYLESANAYNFAGEASVKLGQNAQGIEYFEKFLQLSPNAKGANQAKYQIAEAAKASGNKAKAIEYFQMIAADPQFAEYATFQIKELSK